MSVVSSVIVVCTIDTKLPTSLSKARSSARKLSGPVASRSTSPGSPLSSTVIGGSR